MADSITVAGLMGKSMGGLKESLKEFRVHHQKTGDALMNISGVNTPGGVPVDKDEDRMPYTYQPWPCMLFHHTKGESLAFSEDERQELLRSGYRAEPYPKAQVAIHDPATEKKQLLDSLQKKDGEIAQLGDVLAKALARLDTLEKAQFDAAEPEADSKKKR